jgi:preprotein translocase SecE subunit
MAVAVKNTPESQTRTALGALVPASILGAVYILACGAVVFWGVPHLWEIGVHPYLQNLSFVSYAVLGLFEVVAIVALAYLGNSLVGSTPPRGMRAGIFAVLVWLFATLLVTVVVGRIFEYFLGGAPGVGIGLTGAVAVALLYWGWSLFTRPKAPEKLRAFEDQGWFSTQRLKPMQGQKVRRATMLGIILLIAAGIYSLLNHGTLNSVHNLPTDNAWAIRVPFTAFSQPILPDVKYTVPLILAAVGVWLAFRIVHVPVFADFLIATEAELNKVSWPTRKSVVQDTIVVLTTVLMLTVFLFLVDIAWGWLLSRPVVGVLRQPPAKTQTDQSNVDKTPY